MTTDPTVAADLTGAVPQRQVRALYDDTTITVYQAYRAAVADAALAAGTFVAPFSVTRMTWVKPSFLWMMYRCGWASKPDQERVLAVRMTRAGFEEALALAWPSSYEHGGPYADRAAWQRAKRDRPVRFQWDPERDHRLHPLPYRSLQVGLGPEVVPDYVGRWVVGVDDVTDLARALGAGSTDVSPPVERPYPLPDAVAATLGASRG